ncbi:MAG: hypothetical protein OIF55_08490 [Amphritea sp.]|nr:hypothetical protein [Amphritea sp.]
MITREASFLAGMPNLSLHGLSEHWLLKECGNQHWLALAELFGLPLPDFRSSNNTPVYAAFVAVELQDLALHLIDENASFSLTTRLIAIGPARFYSEHQLYFADYCCATISMISTQVSRTEAGNNQSVVRTELPLTNSPSKQTTTPLKERAQALIRSAKSFRSDRWQSWQGLQPDPAIQLPGYSHFPCPNNDFNGADFLYFANFQAAADRAEWHWNRNRELWQIEARQLNYYGNINIGDALLLEFSALQSDAQSLRHCLTIRRDSDGQKIADILTCKSRIQNARYRWAQRR